MCNLCSPPGKLSGTILLVSQYCCIWRMTSLQWGTYTEKYLEYLEPLELLSLTSDKRINKSLTTKDSSPTFSPSIIILLNTILSVCAHKNQIKAPHKKKVP